MLAADPEYLDSAFLQIDQEFGGLDGYLSGALSLGDRERDALRANLLA